MSVFSAVILGIIQGLAEFLPISSSGHLLIGEKLLGVGSTGLLLEILLHIGTLGAVVIVFWNDFWAIICHPIKDTRFRLLIIATIPTILVALFANDFIERLFTGWFLGVSFIITAVLLWLSEKVRSKAALSHDVKPKHAVVMGVMQAFAILPGVSRSGSTIAGGIASGLERENAARFSFMMSAVAIVGSLVFKLKDLLEFGAESLGGFAAPLAGVVAAMVTGYLAIRFMMNILKTKTLKPFAIYVAIVGVLVLCDQLFFGRFFDRIL